jgi:quercetin dioxygenase-like cupin family protein
MVPINNRHFHRAPILAPMQQQSHRRRRDKPWKDHVAMFDNSKIAKTVLRSIMVATLAAGGTGAASNTASAGSCPKDKVLAKPRAIENAPDVGVEREILSMVKLQGWRGVGDLYLRTRRLTVAKDGIVPYHEHDDRPSIVTIVTGELIEHSALCAVPILHRAGETTPEFGAGHAHWWENKTGATVVLLSSDVVPPEMMDDPDM